MLDLRIPDVRKRAREYLLGLGVYASAGWPAPMVEEIRRAWTSALTISGARLGAVGRWPCNVVDVVADFDDEALKLVVDDTDARRRGARCAVSTRPIYDVHAAPDTSAPETVQADEARLREPEATLQTITLDARQREREARATERSEQRLTNRIAGLRGTQSATRTPAAPAWRCLGSVRNATARTCHLQRFPRP